MQNFIRRMIVNYTSHPYRPFGERLKNAIYQDYLKNKLYSSYPEDIKTEIQARIEHKKTHKYIRIYDKINRLEVLLANDYFINVQNIYQEIEKEFFKTPIKNRLYSEWRVNKEVLNKIAMSAIIKKAKHQIKYAKEALAEEDFDFIDLKLLAIDIPDTSEIVIDPKKDIPVSLYGIPIVIDDSVDSFKLIKK